MTVASEAGKIVRALRAAHLHDIGRRGLLQMACDRLRARGAPYTSVYAYMLHGNELALESHAGRDTDHTRIPVGKGVCGTAIDLEMSMLVKDVHEFAGHIACDAASRSELVVLLRDDDGVFGLIDLDSPTPSRFDKDDQAGIEALAAIYVAASSFED